MWFVGHDFSDASIVVKENTKPYGDCNKGNET